MLDVSDKSALYNVIYGLSLCMWSIVGMNGQREESVRMLLFCEMLSHDARYKTQCGECSTICPLPVTQMEKHDNTSTLSCECWLPGGLRPDCGDFGVWESRALDPKGQAVLVLQVGGEVEDAGSGWRCRLSEWFHSRPQQKCHLKEVGRRPTSWPEAEAGRRPQSMTPTGRESRLWSLRSPTSVCRAELWRNVGSMLIFWDKTWVKDALSAS